MAARAGLFSASCTSTLREKLIYHFNCTYSNHYLRPPSVQEARQYCQPDNLQCAKWYCCEKNDTAITISSWRVCRWQHFRHNFQISRCRRKNAALLPNTSISLTDKLKGWGEVGWCEHLKHIMLEIHTYWPK